MTTQLAQPLTGFAPAVKQRVSVWPARCRPMHPTAGPQPVRGSPPQPGRRSGGVWEGWTARRMLPIARGCPRARALPCPCPAAGGAPPLRHRPRRRPARDRPQEARGHHRHVSAASATSQLELAGAHRPGRATGRLRACSAAGAPAQTGVRLMHRRADERRGLVCCRGVASCFGNEVEPFYNKVRACGTAAGDSTVLSPGRFGWSKGGSGWGAAALRCQAARTAGCACATAMRRSGFFRVCGRQGSFGMHGLPLSCPACARPRAPHRRPAVCLLPPSRSCWRA